MSSASRADNHWSRTPTRRREEGSPLCCAAAADADGNAGVNLTDGVYLLGFLFSGGSAPPAPFPLCAPGTQDALECDQEVCPTVE